MSHMDQRMTDLDSNRIDELAALLAVARAKAPLLPRGVPSSGTRRLSQGVLLLSNLAWAFA